MSDSLPHSPTPEKSPNHSNPNPNSDSTETDPPHKSQLLTPETKNPPPKSPFKETQKNPDQVIQPLGKRSNLSIDVDDEQEDEDENDDEEGITNMSLSSPLKVLTSKSSKVSSVRRNKKRKKGAAKKNTTVYKHKMGVLSEGFKPIPFVPRKNLDFSRYEENLRTLGLWDFVHLEFDANVRVDLLLEFVAGYTPKTRVSYVNGFRVKVSRADLARALRLPVKKPTLDSEGESYSGEFLPFLEEFVLSWMVLQESDVWVTPNEIVNCIKMIKEGQLHKVDWAGIVWFMMEKELSQGHELKDCHYASLMQRLIKDQREQLFTESVELDAENQKVVESVDLDAENQKAEESVDLDAENQKVDQVNVEDEDVKMLDEHESSLGEERLQAESVVLKLDQERAAVVETVDAATVETVGVPAVKTVAAADMAEKEKCSDMVQKDGDVDMVERMEEVEAAEMDSEVSKLKEVDDVDEEKNENNVGNIESFDVANDMENIENVEPADNVEDPKGMTVDDIVDFGFEKHWQMHGINDGRQHIMQPCSMSVGLKMSVEDSSRDVAGEDVEDEVGEDDKPGYDFMVETTTTMEGMTARNLMDAIETGHLSFSSAELGGQSSLSLMPSRAENDVILNGPSMFNHLGKREIDHEHDFSHHALGDSHKRMRMDEHWNDKTADSRMCVNEAIQWMEKVKSTLESEKYQQENMMQMYVNQIDAKETEVMQWRCKFDDLQRSSNAEIHRRDRELHLMHSVIDGYRKALKDTQRAFSEYRKRCRIPDEPIYKDAGNGGVVKSIMELEKERIKQEEERKRMRNVLEDAYNKHVLNCVSICRELHIKVMSLDDKLTDAAKEVELLKDDFVKRKMSGNAAMTEEVQSEAQELQEDDSVTHKVSENDAILEEGPSEAQEVLGDSDNGVEPKSSEDVSDNGVEPKLSEDVSDNGVEPKSSEDVEMSEDVVGEAQGV